MLIHVCVSRCTPALAPAAAELAISAVALGGVPAVAVPGRTVRRSRSTALSDDCGPGAVAGACHLQQPGVSSAKEAVVLRDECHLQQRGSRGASAQAERGGDPGPFPRSVQRTACVQCEAEHSRPCDAVTFSCAHHELAHLLTCAELNEIKENGGKLFEADMDLLKLEDVGAVTFPDVDAWPVVASGGVEPLSPVNLSERLAGKVSLVTVSPPPHQAELYLQPAGLRTIFFKCFPCSRVLVRRATPPRPLYVACSPRQTRILIVAARDRCVYETLPGPWSAHGCRHSQTQSHPTTDCRSGNCRVSFSPSLSLFLARALPLARSYARSLSHRSDAQSNAHAHTRSLFSLFFSYAQHTHPFRLCNCRLLRADSTS